MKLGVFDSGIGGEAVAAALQRTFPEAEILTVNDHDNVPYGEKSPQQVIALTDAAIQPLLRAGCDIIILACNTATALAIEWLRDRYTTQKFIGIEPMIKSAAKLTHTKTVAVCATPATLKSARYAGLVKKFGSDLTIIEPDCSQWAYWIENNQLNHNHVADIINTVCSSGADVIVLGCTHYHWIKELIIELAAGRAAIIEPSDAIGRRVVELLDRTSAAA
jgi:glutamate racemase